MIEMAWMVLRGAFGVVLLVASLLAVAFIGIGQTGDGCATEEQRLDYYRRGTNLALIVFPVWIVIVVRFAKGY